MSWPIVKLGEVCELRNGYTPKADALVNDKQVGSVPYFRVAAMNYARDGVWMDKPSAYCVAPKRLFPKGTVVFPKNGGAIYTGKVRILEEESIVDLNTAVATPLEGVTTEYLYYYVRALSLEDYIVPGTLPFVDFQLLRSAPLPLPPLSEQRQIVAELERKLSRLEKMEGNFRAMAETAAQAFRSALSEAFRSLDAPTAKLGEVCEVIYGFPFNSKRFNKERQGSPLIRIRNVLTGKSETYTDEPCDKRYHVQTGDILIGMDGDFNIAAWSGGKACLNQRVCKLCPRNGVLSRYLLHILGGKLREVWEKKSFTTVKHLLASDLASLSLPLPPLFEQKCIVAGLEVAQKRLSEVEKMAREAVVVCAQARRAVLAEAFRHE